MAFRQWILLLAGLCSAAQAENFVSKDSQYNQTTHLTVIRPVSNALADEGLMGKIIAEAHAELMLQMYKLNASNKLPEQMLSMEDVKLFDLREEQLGKIVLQANKMVQSVRERQPGDGLETGDLIPDALLIYYPLFKGTGRYALLGQVAAVATMVKDQEYEVSVSEACNAVTREQIKQQLLRGGSVAGCEVKLIEEKTRPDVSIYLMAGMDSKLLGNGNGNHKSAGFGFIWDTRNQMTDAGDLNGGGLSISLGPIFKPAIGGVQKLYTKVSKMLKKTKVAEKSVGAGYESFGAGALESLSAESVEIRVPTQFNTGALMTAFKDANNFRIGGIYKDLPDADKYFAPEYVLLSFDLSGVGLKDVFGLADDEADVTATPTPTKSTKGPPLKLAGFFFFEIQDVLKFGLNMMGWDNNAEAALGQALGTE